jgi:hypothetical protein
MPIDLVLDVLSLAAKSVSETLSLKLEVPPVPLKTVKKKVPNNNEEQNSSIPEGYKIPAKRDNIFEIWKIFLEDNPEKITEAYVILNGDFVDQGYKKGIWENIEYKGFYTTLEEAQNEISGYLD